MKVGARTRLTMVVIMGIIAGLGFISLPSILAVRSAPSTTSPPSPTTRSGTNSTTTSSSGSATIQSVNTTSVKLTNSTNTQVPAGTSITPDAFSVLFSLMVVPALALSWVATVLVSGRARKVLADSSEDESSGESSGGS